MSDASISIVPKKSSYPNHLEKADEILQWLIFRDIVKPTLSDCILGSKYGYAISDGAIPISRFPDQLPFDSWTNGLQVITERRVFDTGENWIDKLICPHCTENIAFIEWDLDSWYSRQSDNFTCALCRHQTDIHDFTFEPDWGFSDLGFIFWNWGEFTDEFIADFKKN